MNERKPRLCWIEQVLADESADQVPLTAVAASKRVSIVRHATEDPPYAFDGDDPLPCPSWQLMRLTVANKS